MTTVDDGRQAAGLLERQRFDLILTDMVDGQKRQVSHMPHAAIQARRSAVLRYLQPKWALIQAEYSSKGERPRGS